MTDKMLELKIGGLKCDTPGCGYKDMSIKFEDYPKYINAKCPLCGANLLTQECYDNTMKMVQRAEKFNSLLEKLFKKKKKDASEITSYGTIDLDERGKIKGITYDHHDVK